MTGEGHVTRTWRSSAGAWLGIATSPGALVLGAQLSADNGGAVPVATLAAGLALMGGLLYLQGRLGLVPPRGLGQGFVALTWVYFSPWSRRLVGATIACGMVGWVAFAIGIGAESLSRMTGSPQAVGSVVIGTVILALAIKEVHKWNVATVVTTVSTLALAAMVIVQLQDRVVPVTASLGTPAVTLGSVAALVGYVAVFSVRAPDFTVGMRSRRDVVASIALLLLPALALFLVGAELSLTSATAEDGTFPGLTLITWGGLQVGDLLLIFGAMAPGIVSAYSGGLALQVFVGARLRQGIVAVTVLSIVLASLDFQEHLFPFLALLAGVLPPIVMPFWAETALRRRGAVHRVIPWWTWVPASVFGGALVLLHYTGAPLAALSASAVCSFVYFLLRRRRQLSEVN